MNSNGVESRVTHLLSKLFLFILSLETRERNKGLNCISSTLIYVNKTSRSSQIKSWKLESLKAFDSI